MMGEALKIPETFNRKWVGIRATDSSVITGRGKKDVLTLKVKVSMLKQW